MRVPCSTYRLQFHSNFRLTNAAELVRYFEDLGITDIYSSPLLRSRRGSTHGYDVTDPTQLDPEIGMFDELSALARSLQSRDMGLLLDIVPNHMSASSENAWWWDVLRRGEWSKYASAFDVDWSRKVLLPILQRPYGEVLESGELRVH